MFGHLGWLYIVIGLVIAIMVSVAIPYAARRSEPRPR
jgi:hypothetical protein